MEEELPDVHDGGRVREVVEKSGLGVEAFQKEMDWNPTKRYRMFQRASWTSLDLMLASRVLNYDFFKVYRDWTRDTLRTATIMVPVTVSLPLDLEMADLGNLDLIFRPASNSPDQ